MNPLLEHFTARCRAARQRMREAATVQQIQAAEQEWTDAWAEAATLLCRRHGAWRTLRRWSQIMRILERADQEVMRALETQEVARALETQEVAHALETQEVAR